MRELKFRAWDKKEKQMWDMDNPTFSFPPEYDWEVGSLVWFFEIVKNAHEMEIMQYTGLRDKKGVEIYEGDIIKVDIHEDKYTARVEYMPFGCVTAAFHFVKITPSLKDNSLFSPWASVIPDNDDEDHFEIIGNIYKNPELLKEKNETINL